MFFFQEYNVAMKKKASNKNIAFTIGELVGYRLDYHFSSSKMAKPLLFFAITFVGERGDQVRAQAPSIPAMSPSFPHLFPTQTHLCLCNI
jgi:hypothetical protein